MKVDVYSSPTCPHCHALKEFLSLKGIRYQDHDASVDPLAASGSHKTYRAERGTGNRY